jgi:four helix bundle protein
MTTIKKFEDLEMWKKSRILCNEIFEIIKSENFSKDYKLKDQINGSSGSVMDNIAEGFDRGSRLEFLNFLSISKGSAGEVKSQLYRAVDRKYINSNKFDELYSLAEEISKMIGSFMEYLNKSNIKGTKFKSRTGN